MVGIFLGMTGIFVSTNLFKFKYIYNKISNVSVSFTSKCMMYWFMIWKIMRETDSSIGFFIKIKGSNHYYTTVINEDGKKNIFINTLKLVQNFFLNNNSFQN